MLNYKFILIMVYCEIGINHNIYMLDDKIIFAISDDKFEVNAQKYIPFLIIIISGKVNTIVNRKLYLQFINKYNLFI